MNETTTNDESILNSPKPTLTNPELQKEFEEKFCFRDNENEYHNIFLSIRPNIVWLWIEQKLKDQREKYYYHIENSFGTKEADYIDKMVNTKEKKWKQQKK